MLWWYMSLSLTFIPSDRLGPEELLIRLNEDSVLTWLTAKVERTSSRILGLTMEVAATNRCVRNAGGTDCTGSYAEGFSSVATKDDISRRKELEAESKQHALEAVCEYIDEKWGQKLAEKFR